MLAFRLILIHYQKNVNIYKLFLLFSLQKRKTLRASLAMQRQYNVGLNAHTGTISLAVDKNRYPRLGPRGPERAWPGDSDILRNRKIIDEKSLKKNQQTIPKYTSAYTTDVSHLVV